MKYNGKYAGQRLPRRIIAMLIAVCFMGLGVAIFKACQMGSDPFSTMNLGLSSKFGMSFGSFQAIVNIVLLIVVLFFDRSMLGLGTLGNMFLVGFSCDFCTWVFNAVAPWIYNMNFVMRVIFTLLGVAIILLSCSVYVTSNLGLAPYDCISFIVPNKTKIPFRVWRIFVDVACVLIGFFCGSAVGIGTIIMAFGTGPLLPIFNKHFSAKILKISDVRKY